MIGIKKASPVILQPIMAVEVQVPAEYQVYSFTSIFTFLSIVVQTAIISQLARRKGTINETYQVGELAIVKADVPLNEMFGYSTEVRSATQGKGLLIFIYVYI